MKSSEANASVMKMNSPGVNSDVPLVLKSKWRFLPLVCATLMLLGIVWLEPLLAGAPWWQIYEEGLGVALFMPWLPWILCTGLAVLIGPMTTSRSIIIFLSLVSLSSSLIPAVIWTLLLGDIAPDSRSLWISMSISGFASVALFVLLIALAVRYLYRSIWGRRIK